jgi:hypothetical protein
MTINTSLQMYVKCNDYKHDYYGAPEVLILLHQNYNSIQMYHRIKNLVIYFTTVKLNNSIQWRQISKVTMYHQMSGCSMILCFPSIIIA